MDRRKNRHGKKRKEVIMQDNVSLQAPERNESSYSTRSKILPGKSTEV
jgi:hypothetical protein